MQLTIHRTNSHDSLQERIPVYDIMIEQSFSQLPAKLEELHLTGRRICIVTDSKVAPLYLEQVRELLTDNEIYTFTFPAGEENKTLDVVRDLYEVLIQNRFERKDLLLALGGGVVGDLTGFAAATYLRGVDFIQVPTTLLAQVDSSIGGKTGVDFSSYKNMVGAFHMPKLVYINTSTLHSLDQRTFNSGFGEIIKHGYIKNANYLDFLKINFKGIQDKDPVLLAEMIYESCKIKGDVVEKDPTEKGERALLNFGHTLGHAVEKLCGFTLYHGECVVLGMICALGIGVNRKTLPASVLEDAIALFKDYEYPLKVSGMTANEVVTVSKSDKKMDQNTIKFILLEEVGKAYIDHTVTDQEMEAALQLILK